MKPRIWKRGDMWYCGYYPKRNIGVHAGRTPYIAWYLWKYRGYHSV